MKFEKDINNLSDREYQDLLRPIQEFLVIEDEPKKVDAIFVFGSIKLPLIYDRILELYRGGYAKYILVTGGIGSNNFSEGNLVSEAGAISDFLIKNGVLEEIIIREDEATNTLENVQFGVKKLGEFGVNPQSLILVAKPGHMRRCVATFQKHYPDIELICCPPKGSIFDFIDRPKEDFAKRSIAEIERLIQYTEKGDIIRQDIPDNIFECIENIEKYLN